MELNSKLERWVKAHLGGQYIVRGVDTNVEALVWFRKKRVILLGSDSDESLQTRKQRQERAWENVEKKNISRWKKDGVPDRGAEVEN